MINAYIVTQYDLDHAYTHECLIFCVAMIMYVSMVVSIVIYSTFYIVTVTVYFSD